MKHKVGKSFTNKKKSFNSRSFDDEWNDGKKLKKVDYKKRKYKTYDIMRAIDDDDYEGLYE